MPSADFADYADSENPFTLASYANRTLFHNQRNLRSKRPTSCFPGKKSCCQESNLWLSELQRSGHYLVALARDPVVVSFENLVDQFVCAQ